MFPNPNYPHLRIRIIKISESKLFRSQDQNLVLPSFGTLSLHTCSGVISGCEFKGLRPTRRPSNLNVADRLFGEDWMVYLEVVMIIQYLRFLFCGTVVSWAFVGSAVVQKYRKGSEKIKKCKTKIQKSIILTKCISFCRICMKINRRGATGSQKFAKGSQMEANKRAKGSQKRACKSQKRTEGSQKGAKVCQTGAKRKRKGDPGAS